MKHLPLVLFATLSLAVLNATARVVGPDEVREPTVCDYLQPKPTTGEYLDCLLKAHAARKQAEVWLKGQVRKPRWAPRYSRTDELESQIEELEDRIKHLEKNR